MALYNERGNWRVTVNDTSMSYGIYAADGSLRVKIVDGSTFTGLMAADGSYNVVIVSADSSLVSLYHPCGAWRVIDASNQIGVVAPNGALYVDGLGVAFLFANNEVGGWWDPSDLSSMFQDSAGTTPVTAVEQSVGLHLDKSKGLALGAELVQNPDFATDTWWGKGAGWTISGGAANANTAGVAGLTSGSLGLTAGRWYIVRFTATVTSGNISAFLGGTAARANFTTGTYSVYVIAGSSNDYLTFDTLNACVATIDNVSVKQIAGNHRYQSTSAARPVVSARYNLLTKTEDLSHADWLLTSAVIAIPTKVGADEISFPAVTGAGDASVIRQAFASFATTYTGAIELKAKSAGDVGKQIAIYINDGSISNFTFHILTDTYTRITVSETTSAVSPCYFTIAVLGSSFGGIGNQGAVSVNLRYADVRVSNDGTGLPAYQRVNTSTDYDTSGFPMYLKYDGTDDFMETAAVDFSGTDAMSVFAGVRKLSDAAVGFVVELTSSEFANAGAFYLAAPELTGASGNFSFKTRGATRPGAAAYSGTILAPVTYVLTGLGDISGDIASIRSNGTQVDYSADQGTGNFANAKLFFGARNGTAFFFGGREYQMIIRGAASTAAEIASAEAYVNSRTKAY